MRQNRTLVLRKEALGELSADDLRLVAAGNATYGTICQGIRDALPWLVITVTWGEADS